jgi:hypothetical protein
MRGWRHRAQHGAVGGATATSTQLRADGAATAPSSAPAPGSPRRTPRDLVRRVVVHLLVVCTYSLFGVLLWWRSWDGHLTTALTCACGDAGQAVWFVAWPAYALSHGLDPFFSGALFAPHGVNLLVNASSTVVGIALTPLTLAAGPVAATTVALTLAPGLSAWACWIACRRMVRWGPAAAIAGLLFGYSPFVVSNLALGHVGLALLVAPPLLVLALATMLFGHPAHPARLGVAVGLLVGLQFFVSPEILAALVVVGLPVTAAAALVGRARLARLPDLARGLGAAGVTSVLLLAAPLWFMLGGPRHLSARIWPGAPIDGNALSAFVSPGLYGAHATTLLRLGGYEGLRGPPSAYLGPFVLGAAALALVVAWRRAAAWVLASLSVVAAVLSLGILLVLDPGHAVSVWTPWRLLATLPLLDDVIPQRFSAVVDLGVALLVGVGADAAFARYSHPRGAASAPTVRRARAARSAVTGGALLAVGALGAGSLWWTFQVPFATGTVSVPRWFSQRAPSLPASSVVVSIPFPFPTDASSAPMVWQALDGMAFRLAGGYAKAPGRRGAPLGGRTESEAERVLAGLSGAAAGPLPTGSPAELAALRQALAAWHVRDVVVTGRARDPRLAVAILSDAIRAPPLRRAGAWVWVLSP